MWRLLLLLPLVSGQQLYDAFSGKPITEDRRNDLAALNLTIPCTISVAPCRHEEDRRVDGTCTNPKYPSLGAVPTRLLRMRPARYGLVSYATVSDCCLGNTPNRVNPKCISIPVPQDDPYLRRTDIRCMNLTRFPTFQELQCAPNSLPAERYVILSTPLMDLSTVYGSTNERGRQIRSYERGLLKSEMRNGLEYPPGTAPVCVNNRRPIENNCYEFGESYGGNLVSGVYLTAMWFFREHNRLARKLAEINPCWDDQKLFKTARQINIAQWQYILYYEATAAVLAERVFGELQRASDLLAIDMMRGRDEGLAPYHEYRKLCGLPHANKFSDLEDTIYPDKLEQMRRIYDGEIDDVELMVALYSERRIKGGWVGPTLFCIMARNMVEWRKSDRLFFEHGDIPAALTLPQLREVRSTSTARIICDNGDRVDKIQPHAMYNIGAGNELTPCEAIPGIDLTKWADPHCQDETHKEEPNTSKDDVDWAKYYYK